MSTEERILEVLRAHPGIRTTTVTKFVLGCGWGEVPRRARTVYSVLMSMRQRGLVRSEGKKWYPGG